MTKKKFLSIGLISLALFLIPFTVKAKEAVTIYFFKGATCSHCKNANAFFEELARDEEYKDKFVVESYEVWSNKDNAKLMDEVAKYMKDDVNGAVPYIIIGDKSWKGYSSSLNDAIKKQILTVYNDEKYVDEIKNIVNNRSVEKDNTLITVVIISGMIVMAGVALYLARKDTDEEEDQKAETIEKKEVIEEKKTTTTPEKKTTKAKTSSSKSTPKKETVSKTTAKKTSSTKTATTSKTTPKKNSSKKTSSKTTNNAPKKKAAPKKSKETK